MGQHVLQRRRALDGHQLAQLPLRLDGPERTDDGRQAPAEPLGAGAVGPAVRLPSAQHPRAAGADGRRGGRPPLRPHSPPLWPDRGFRLPGWSWPPRRSRSPSRATTTRTSCSCCARWPPCGSPLRALDTGRTRWLVLSGVAVGLGFETKMGVALFVVPGHRAGLDLVACSAPARRAGARCVSCWPAASRWQWSAWPGPCS